MNQEKKWKLRMKIQQNCNTGMVFVEMEWEIWKIAENVSYAKFIENYFLSDNSELLFYESHVLNRAFFKYWKDGLISINLRWQNHNDWQKLWTNFMIFRC